MYDIILKKRNGQKLSKQEIEYVINGYNNGNIPDYQVSALLMAIYYMGLDHEETTCLTKSMFNSGTCFDLSSIPGIKVDKHSTGGVGDKTTLVLIPLVAAAGVKVAKMSGRGLGHTGGTVDKLESIPGFIVDLPYYRFMEQLRNVGAAVIAQTDQVVPADKKLYALRDVTATIDSIPLIASSIMSKKAASGADAIVLDVKVGSGAFMKNVETANQLADTMVSIGNLIGRKTVALITNMDQPLGFAVGNSLELKEAVQTLQGNGPDDLLEICLALGEAMLLIAGKPEKHQGGRDYLLQLLNKGLAFKKFEEIVAAQSGDVSAVRNPENLPKAPIIQEVYSPSDGYVQGILAEKIGRCSMILGAGRECKEDRLDLAAGIVMKKKVGDYVKAGESLAVIHTSREASIQQAHMIIRDAYLIGKEKPSVVQLVWGSIH